MERRHPEWKDTRKSFAPTFGMMALLLKKRKLKEDGEQALFVEQNYRLAGEGGSSGHFVSLGAFFPQHCWYKPLMCQLPQEHGRPQLLYTEHDRPILDEAWQETGFSLIFHHPSQ